METVQQEQSGVARLRTVASLALAVLRNTRPSHTEEGRVIRDPLLEELAAAIQESKREQPHA